MSRICVVGQGYVGLSTAVCLAELGNDVIGVDVDAGRVAQLNRGEPPIYEPGLDEMLNRNREKGRLSFTTRYEVGMDSARMVFIAVGTPSASNGQAELSYVRTAARNIAEVLTSPIIVVNKSTVPIGTGDLVSRIIRQTNPQAVFAVVSNPEFLREGSAIRDFMNPARVVLGSNNRDAAEEVAKLHSALRCPIVMTDTRTAEMIKYASNAFLATRISFMNEIATICDALGADVSQVARAMGLDDRIGSSYLDAGLGFGGSCFPKDVQALAHMAQVYGGHPQLLRAVLEINRSQRLHVVRRLRDMFGTLEGMRIGMLGLAFKPDTDDMRDAPAVDIAQSLISEGAIVQAYDPMAMQVARSVLHPDVRLVDDAYAAAAGTDAVVIVTEWNEFRQLDLARLKASMVQPVLVDGRNIYEPTEMRSLGFVYSGVGRGQALVGDRPRLPVIVNAAPLLDPQPPKDVWVAPNTSVAVN